MNDQTTRQSDTDRYLTASAAETVSSFLARHAAWNRKVSQHQVDPTSEYNVRSRPSERSKDQAYDAGGRIARLLGLEGNDLYPRTTGDLARLVALALDSRS